MCYLNAFHLYSNAPTLLDSTVAIMSTTQGSSANQHYHAWIMSLQHTTRVTSSFAHIVVTEAIVSHHSFHASNQQTYHRELAFERTQGQSSPPWSVSSTIRTYERYQSFMILNPIHIPPWNSFPGCACECRCVGTKAVTKSCLLSQVMHMPNTRRQSSIDRVRQWTVLYVYVTSQLCFHNGRQSHGWVQ